MIILTRQRERERDTDTLVPTLCTFRELRFIQEIVQSRRDVILGISCPIMLVLTYYVLFVQREFLLLLKILFKHQFHKIGVKFS